MNRQRKVVITVTYNELGTIIDTKAEELDLSTQPERKKGKWIRNNTYHGDDTSGFVDPDWKCSVCGKSAIVNSWMLYDLTNFCPHCGADMRGEEDG